MRFLLTALSLFAAIAWAPVARADVFDPAADPNGLASVSSGTACTPTGTETVATDAPDYPAWAAVQIGGAGYSPGCDLVVRVTRPDGSVVRGDGTESDGADLVTTDADGSFTYTYQLTNIAGSYLIEVLGSGDAVLAQASFWDAAALNTLTIGGVENYVATAGDTIQANGAVDTGRFYRWFVQNPAGVEVASTTCASTGTGGAVTNTYTVQAADPVSNAASWTYRLIQYTAAGCASQDGPNNRTKTFNVAKSATFSNSTATTPKTVFAPPGPAHVNASGLFVEGGNPNGRRWSVSWILPSNATACSNTAGNDRPVVSSTGLLPDTGTPLQYAPGAGALDTWNLAANYDGTCPPMGATNEGNWKVRLQRDVTHFVTLSAFTVDATAPNTTVDTSPTNPSNDSTPSFAFSGTDNISSGANLTFECKLDAAAFAACTSPKDYTTTADGSHTFQVRATDQAGNVDASPASYTWTIDTAAPNAPTINTHPDDPTNATSANFTFTGAEGGGTFQCKLEASGTYASCTSPQAYSSLSQGSHTFFVRQVDAAGNLGAATTFTWFVDTTAPDTSIDTKPNDPSNDSTPSFAFSGTDSHSAANNLTFECKLDAAAFAPCTSPKDYTATTDGSHTFQVRAIDQAGNVDASPASYTWTIDTVAPSAPTIDTSPDDPTNATAADFTFTGAEAGGSFQCKLETGGTYAPCSSPQSYSSVSEGSHTFFVRQVDAAGNPGVAASVTWYVDLTDPNTSIDAQPSDPSSNASPSFEFSGTDDHSDDADLTFECNLDDAGWDPCTSPEALTDLSDGEHTFEVRATDEAGSTDATPASFTWTVDTAGPDAPTITDNPPALSNSRAASFEFTGAESGGHFECKLDDNAYAACTSPKSYTSLDDGEHHFRVRQVDGAGNEGAAATYDWIVDATAPNTSIDSQPSDPSKNASPSFEFSGTDNHSDAADLTFECNLDGAGWDACSSPEDLVGLAQGSHTFEVRATDEAGNTDATPASFTWFVDLTAPNTSLDAHASDPTKLTSATFEFSGTDNHSDAADLTFECNLDDAGWDACSSPEELADLAEGSHTFEVRATDEAGNTDATPAGFTWFVDVTAPDTSIDSHPSDPSGNASPSFEFSGTDTHSAAGDLTFECKLDDAGWDACGSPKDLADLADGEHTFAVRATDEAGNTDASPDSYTWVVDTVKPVSAASAPATTNETATTFDVDYSASDERSGLAKVVLYASKDGGAYSSANTDNSPTATGTFSFEHSGDGTYRFYTLATDNAGNVEKVPMTADDSTVVEDAKTVRDTVAPIVTLSAPPATTGDDTPTISGTAGTQAAQDDATADEDHVTVEVLNAAGDTVLHTYSNVPVDGGDGSFSVDTDQLADGHYKARVSQSDGASNSGSDTRSFEVDTDAPDAPTIDSAPDDPTNETTAEFNFTAAESGGTLECKLDGGTFAACSSPKPYTGLAEGSHTFQVRQLDAGGNAGDAASATWFVDLTAPETTITSTPDDPDNDTTPTFAFSGSDSHSAADDLTYECNRDGTGWNPCSSPKELSSLADGSHTFEVRATDEAGNTDASPATYTWTLDTGAPGAPTITATPDDPTKSNEATFEWTAAESGGTFECKLDSAAFALCTSPEPYGALSEGHHSFSVRQVDEAGNAGPTDSYEWDTDYTAPNTQFDAKPPNPSNDATPTFEFSGTDNHSAAADLSFECNRDGAGWNPCGSPLDLATLSEGAHSFAVRATDEAGNTDGSPASYNWTVDTIAPGAPTIATPAEGSFHASGSITVTGAAEPGSTVEVFDGATSVGTTTANASGTWTKAVSLSGGAHTLSARATDAAHNTSSASADRHIVVDAAAPQSQASGPATSSATGLTISYTASDNAGGSGLARVDLWAKGPGATSFTLAGTDNTPNATQSFSYTATVNGSYAFYTVAVDQVGNTEAAPATPDVTTVVTTGPPPFAFTGFFKPLDNLPVLNQAKAGSSVPVKFGLGGDKGMNIFAAGYPISQVIPCDSSALVDGIEQIDSPGASGLSYDAGTQTYHYVWKTEKSWSGCRQLVVKFTDGSYARANMKFTK